MVGRFSDEALARIVELRVRDRLGHDEIGRVLEAMGIATPTGGRWWPGTVRWVLQQAAGQGNADAKEALAVRAARRVGTYKALHSTPPDVVERIQTLRSEGMSLQEIGEMLKVERILSAARAAAAGSADSATQHVLAAGRDFWHRAAAQLALAGVASLDGDVEALCMHALEAAFQARWELDDEEHDAERPWQRDCLQRSIDDDCPRAKMRPKAGRTWAFAG